MNYEMNAEPGKFEVKGSNQSAVLTRAAESWQFFAFVFGATLALILSLIDSIVGIFGNAQASACGLAVKILVAAAITYLLLFNRPMRNRLVRWLQVWKQEYY